MSIRAINAAMIFVCFAMLAIIAFGLAIGLQTGTLKWVSF